LSYLNAYLNLF